MCMLDELAFDQSAPMECEKQQQEKGSNTKEDYSRLRTLVKSLSFFFLIFVFFFPEFFSRGATRFLTSTRHKIPSMSPVDAITVI